MQLKPWALPPRAAVGHILYERFVILTVIGITTSVNGALVSANEEWIKQARFWLPSARCGTHYQHIVATITEWK